MPYGILKADTITYYTATGDVSVAVSGIAIQGASVISGVSGIFTTSVSGATVTGNAGQFTTITGGTAQFTSVTGVSGVFTTRISGATVTGDTGQFTTLTAVSGVFTTNISGATISGDVGLFGTISGGLGVFSNVLSVPSGTAGSPSVSFNGDPNTGLYSPGADQVAISTNGTGRLFVDASGNVGVNTASAIAPGGFGYAREFALTAATSGDSSVSINLRGSRTVAGGFGDINFWHQSTSNRAYIQARRGSSDSAIDLDFITSGGAGMRLDSSGRLGLGTSSASSLFHALNPSDGASTTEVSTIERNNSGYFFKLYRNAGSGNTGGLIGADSAGTYYTGGHNTANMLYIDSGNSAAQIYTNSTARLTVDSSGRLLVGTSTSRSQGQRFQVEGTDFPSSSVLFARNDAGGASSNLTFLKSRGATPGSVTSVVDGDRLARLEFQGADGTNAVIAGMVECFVDGTPGTNDMPGRLVFSTTADGASAPTERVRISQNGVVTVKNGAVAEIGTLTDGATITPDFAANCNFTLTISGSRTLANPTNITAGQTGSIFIIQGSGSNTLSWGSYWDFTGGTAPTLSTASGAVDRVDYVVRTSTSIHTVFTANYS